MNILIIRDDKPGHYNQTEGLLVALKNIYPNSNIEFIEVEINNKINRKFLKFLLNKFTFFFTNRFNLKYLFLFFKKYNLPLSKPDLILSTGGNTANLNAWLSKAYNSRNILNGALRGLKEELFFCITTVIDLGYKNQLILDVAPSVINEDSLKKKSEEFLKVNIFDKKIIHYALLIGGDGSGYKYDEEFYNKLIYFVKKVSKEKSIKWLITTSRRTSLDIENKLEKELSDYCTYFVSFNKKEEKVLLPFLGLSKFIFVTEESASMISEAIASLKPVFTISNNLDTDNINYNRILEKFENEKKIKRIFNLEKNDFDNKNFRIENLSEKLEKKIKGKLLI